MPMKFNIWWFGEGLRGGESGSNWWLGEYDKEDEAPRGRRVGLAWEQGRGRMGRGLGAGPQSIGEVGEKGLG